LSRSNLAASSATSTYALFICTKRLDSASAWKSFSPTSSQNVCSSRSVIASGLVPLSPPAATPAASLGSVSGQACFGRSLLCLSRCLPHGPQRTPDPSLAKDAPLRLSIASVLYAASISVRVSSFAFAVASCSSQRSAPSATFEPLPAPRHIKLDSPTAHRGGFRHLYAEPSASQQCVALVGGSARVVPAATLRTCVGPCPTLPRCIASHPRYRHPPHPHPRRPRGLRDISG
jgi:hypothetical protein